MEIMLDNHARIMQFFSMAKEVTGRKKLQKMIYILQQCHVPFEEKYNYHFYGPYSEELTLRIEELCNLGFLQENKEEKSSYYQYHYQITPEGEQFLRQFSLNMPDYSDKVEKLQEKSSRFLELVATLLYFDHLSRDEAFQKIQALKPSQNYSEEEMEEAVAFIRELKGA